MNLKLNFSGLSGTVVDIGSKWSAYAAACMGGSFFLRMAYYFGLVNLRDIGGFELFSGLILPCLTAAAFVLALKIPVLNRSAVFLALAAVVSVNYFFTASIGAAGVISGILQFAATVLFGAVCLGVPVRAAYVSLAGLAVLIFRVLFVDLFGFLLPLGEFALIPYVARCADLFSLAALSLLYLTVRTAPSPAPAEAVAE